MVNGQKSKSVEVLSLFAVNRFRKKTLRFIVGSRQPKLSIRVYNPCIMIMMIKMMMMYGNSGNRFKKINSRLNFQ